jgi:hypothetical protein
MRVSNSCVDFALDFFRVFCAFRGQYLTFNNAQRFYEQTPNCRGILMLSPAIELLSYTFAHTLIFQEK